MAVWMLYVGDVACHWWQQLCNWRLSAGQAASTVQGLATGQRTQSGDNNIVTQSYFVERVAVSDEAPLRRVRAAGGVGGHLARVQEAVAVIMLRARDQTRGREVRTCRLLTGLLQLKEDEFYPF